MPFTLKDPLTNGQLSVDQKAVVDGGIAAANVAGPNKPLIISAGNDVGPWYITGQNRVDVNRWAACMVATKNYMTNRAVVAWAQPFNEPDYGPWNMGNGQDLHDIMAILQADPGLISVAPLGQTSQRLRANPRNSCLSVIMAAGHPNATGEMTFVRRDAILSMSRRKGVS